MLQQSALRLQLSIDLDEGLRHGDSTPRNLSLSGCQAPCSHLCISVSEGTLIHNPRSHPFPPASHSTLEAASDSNLQQGAVQLSPRRCNSCIVLPGQQADWRDGGGVEVDRRQSGEFPPWRICTPSDPRASIHAASRSLDFGSDVNNFTKNIFPKNNASRHSAKSLPKPKFATA